jgi:glutamate N-acetyltransferase/amino-acid N-acetyltransferase
MTKTGALFLPRGFEFSAASAGIKPSRKPDLGLIVGPAESRAAALFTTNRVVAAPVELGRWAIEKSRGRVRAVLVNSGNANCATGRQGLADARAIVRRTARLLKLNPEEVFPSSTGVIGVPLPVSKLTGKLPMLARCRQASLEGLRSFAEAILTTDTRAKLASIPLRSAQAAITGVAKGSGMVHPQLATMLVYVLTDVVASAGELRVALGRACQESFNLISIDGDTSTNDTVLLLASGASGIRLPGIAQEFERGLREVCRSLAEQIVADGEGVGRVVRLRIERAKSRDEALSIAHAISRSLLVKTAWAGADPNWGRILAAIGASGVALDPAAVTILIGKQAVCRAGEAVEFDAAAAHQELAKAESQVTVRLGRGREGIEFLTADLTPEYVRINADYTT